MVLSNPVPGRDADYNDWYDNIHLRDAMRFRGSIATQRFKYAQQQIQTPPDGFYAQYLALYELYDSARYVQEHIDNGGSPRFLMDNSFDNDSATYIYYYPLQYRDKAPRTFASGSVVLELMAAKPGEEQAFRDWYNDQYLPQRFKSPGVTTGAFLAYDRYGQMMPDPPMHDYIGIYRLEQDTARGAWQPAPALADCPHLDATRLAVTCWDILTPRITEDDVHHTTAKALAAEEAARARLSVRTAGA